MHKSAPVRFGTIRARPPWATAGQRIGLLGGSFNPPHAAHRLISQIAIRRLGLTAVWWIVTPGNPLKSKSNLLPLERRLTLCREMASDRRIKITAFEKDLTSPYSAATLGFLRRRSPATSFVWLMGADCLAEFHRWRQWPGIFAELPIAVIDRPGHHLKSLSAPAAHRFAHARVPEFSSRTLFTKRPPRWSFLTGPLSPMSSTSLREATNQP